MSESSTYGLIQHPGPFIVITDGKIPWNGLIVEFNGVDMLPLFTDTAFAMVFLQSANAGPKWRHYIRQTYAEMVDLLVPGALCVVNPVNLPGNKAFVTEEGYFTPPAQEARA